MVVSLSSSCEQRMEARNCLRRQQNPKSSGNNPALRHDCWDSRARSRVRFASDRDAAVRPWASRDARTRELDSPSIDRVVREILAASAVAIATVRIGRAPRAGARGVGTLDHEQQVPREMAEKD